MINNRVGENKNWTNENYSHLSSQVGMTRFELATPRPPDVCATGLRYIPKKMISKDQKKNCANKIKSEQTRKLK